MNRNALFLITASAMLALAAVLSWRYLGGGNAIVSLPAVEGCELHLQTCEAALPAGGRLRLDIEPKRPTPTEPLEITALVDTAAPTALGVRFEGVGMNMGYLEHFVYELAPGPAPNRFSGSAGVFACSSTVMRWRVLARVELDGRSYELPFHFETRQK